MVFNFFGIGLRIKPLCAMLPHWRWSFASEIPVYSIGYPGSQRYPPTYIMQPLP